ncbi:MAG: hypothetical protein JSU60_02815 [Nitrospirota bacterium]|nr:MAG: hypothetical protein JSU60_02815 [Nitrospirota bacterium]
MTKEMKPLQNLASTFLDASLPVERLKLRLQAQTILESLELKKSRSALLRELGLSYFAGKDSSQKLDKGKVKGFLTLGLYLAPSNKSGKNLCTFSCLGCESACLDESGHNLIEKRAGHNGIDVARVVKSWVVEFRRDIAEKILASEIQSARKSARKAGKEFAVRLNCTSDISWESLIASFPGVQCYDYTKDPNRQEMDNYHLTFSWGGWAKGRLAHYKQALARGQKIAFPIVKDDVARVLSLPGTQEMDSTDLRFLDGPEPYGILAVKETGNTEKGIKEGFFLTYDAFQEAVKWIEGGQQ